MDLRGGGICAGFEMNVGQTTYTFNYTGSVQTFVVPSVTVIRVTAIGGCGLGPASYGRGHSISGLFTVTPGQVFDVYVGGAGVQATEANGWTGGGWPNGGNGGGPGSGAFDPGGGGGGGASFLTPTGGGLSSSYIVGGGGGGQSENTDRPSSFVKPGNAGYPSGQPGADIDGGFDRDTNANGGEGGTSSAGGAGGYGILNSGQAGDTGGQGRGGNGGAPSGGLQDPPGGGGGGWHGGGGGGHGLRYSAFWPITGADGGGGSSYVNPIGTFISDNGLNPSGNGRIVIVAG